MEGGNLEDQDVDYRILKWIFTKWDGKAWTGLIWLRIAIPYERDNEPSGVIKCGKFFLLDQEGVSFILCTLKRRKANLIRHTLLIN